MKLTIEIDLNKKPSEAQIAMHLHKLGVHLAKNRFLDDCQYHPQVYEDHGIESVVELHWCPVDEPEIDYEGNAHMAALGPEG